PLLALRPDFDSYLLRSSLALSPDGKTAATADTKGRLHVWDVASGKEHVHTLEVPPGGQGMYCPAFSADGRALAATVFLKSVENVVLYDVASGRPLPTWKLGCRGQPEVLSADGALLAVRLHEQDFR